MTWTYHRDTGEVTDHTGSVVTQLSQPVEVPGDVLELMEQDVMSEGVTGGLSERQIAVLRDAVFENIAVKPEPEVPA